VDEEKRNQVIKHLDELRDQVSERLGADPQRHDPVAAHVQQVRGLIDAAPADRERASVEASGLEKRLLAWEAEHPQLTLLASRVARALEDAGL